MRASLKASRSCLTALRKALSTSSLLVGGVQRLLGQKGLGSLLEVSSKKNSVMRIRRANSSKSALTSDQLICRGLGQKVRPLAKSCVSSSVSVVLDKLTTEEGSRGVLVLQVGGGLVFLRPVRFLLSLWFEGWRMWDGC